MISLKNKKIILIILKFKYDHIKSSFTSFFKIQRS